MKIIPGQSRLKQSSGSGCHSFFVLTLMLVAIGLCSGCGKKPATAIAPAPPPVADAVPTSAPPPQAASPVTEPVVIAPSADDGADLKQLNHAYIGWIVQNRRRPKSFEEFVALSGIQLPQPPAGKRYVIDQNGFINFANN
jgi:hypothetical protein